MNRNKALTQLDVKLLQSYLDSLGIDIVEQMFELYQKQVVLYVNDIESAQQTNSQELWQESCHKMKGAAASVGLSDLHSKLVKIEKSRTEKQDKAELVNRLKQDNENAMTAFKLWLQGAA